MSTGNCETQGVTSRRIRRSSVPTVSPTSPTQASPVASALVARVRGFLEAGEIDRNLSPLTIRQYDHYLNNLLGWLAREEPDVKDLFFSSRRRHTRFDCDWSSDVCSSD